MASPPFNPAKALNSDTHTYTVSHSNTPLYQNICLKKKKLSFFLIAPFDSITANENYLRGFIFVFDYLPKRILADVLCRQLNIIAVLYLNFWTILNSFTFYSPLKCSFLK